MEELGAYLFDADSEAKIILQENEKVQQELIQEFSTEIIDPDGTINEKKLALKGFANEENQAVLNAITHPYVFDKIDERYETILKEKKFPIFVVNAALIYESGLDQHLDYTIMVTTHYGLRLNRVLKRGKLTRREIQKRMDLQLPEESKIKMADFVIDNNGTKEQLKDQVDSIYKQLI